MSDIIEPTVQINIDDRVIPVDTLSDDLQNTIKLFDSWRQRESDLLDDLREVEGDVLLVRAALQHVKDSLLAALKDIADSTTVTEAPAAEVKPKRSNKKKVD